MEHITHSKVNLLAFNAPKAIDAAGLHPLCRVIYRWVLTQSHHSLVPQVNTVQLDQLQELTARQVLITIRQRYQLPLSASLALRGSTVLLGLLESLYLIAMLDMHVQEGLLQQHRHRPYIPKLIILESTVYARRVTNALQVPQFQHPAKEGIINQIQLNLIVFHALKLNIAHKLAYGTWQLYQIVLIDSIANLEQLFRSR